MTDLEKYIIELIDKSRKVGEKAAEAYHTHYYPGLNKATEEAEQARQNLLNYIEQNYERKT